MRGIDYFRIVMIVYLSSILAHCWFEWTGVIVWVALCFVVSVALLLRYRWRYPKDWWFRLRHEGMSPEQWAALDANQLFIRWRPPNR